MLLNCFSPGAAAQDVNLMGKWIGILNVGGGQLRMGLEINHQQNRLEASLYSFDQTPEPIGLEDVILNGNRFSFKQESLQLQYRGVLKPAGDEMAGVLTQGIEIPLNFKRVTEFPVVNRPQTPQGPFPYEITEVRYPNDKSGGFLAGTLTFPREEGRFPCILLITGSGSQDRDETIMNHKPFWVIADYLTRQGMAVLRVDDRGIGESDPGSPEDTTADLVTDVQAGVQFLRNHSRVDKRNIWLIGHSEGGLIAPMVAGADRRIGGIVCLAGPGVPGRELLVEQNRLLRKAQGVNDATLKWFMPLFDDLLEVVLNSEPEQPASMMVEKRKALLAKHIVKAPVLVKLAAGQIDKELEAMIKAVDTSWMRFFLELDPQPALQRTRCPVFGIFGEKDLQVASKQNADPFEQALNDGRCRAWEIKIYPELNHLLQHAKTGSPSEYGTIEETISSDVLEDMLRFMRQHLR